MQIIEVGPRDGLQNEAVMVSTADKVELIRRSVEAGITRIEATSFVHPKRVPQMADAEAVMEQVPRVEGVSYIGLVLNGRGLDRALAATVDEVNLVLCASDTFSHRNQGMSTADNLKLLTELIPQALAANVGTSVTIATAFGCPFEGEIDPNFVVDIAVAMAELGVEEIALADTIGVGVPTQVTQLVTATAQAAPQVRLRAHFHNTRNTGYANAVAAAAAGVTVLDSSTGGIGGCPFAPRATGNIATEDLLYLLHRSGISTGVNVETVMETATWLGEVMDKQVPGQLSRAGNFPAIAGG